MCAKDIGSLIRDLEARKREQQAVSARPILRSDALRGIEAVQRVRGAVEPFLVALREALPQLVERRRLFDGAWQLGVSLPVEPEAPRSRGRAHARIVFDLRAHPRERHHVHVTCRRTAAGRDGPSSQLRVDAALDLSSLREFVEQACLDFAAELLRDAPRGAGLDAASAGGRASPSAGA